jgi:hypothetical protein
MSRLSPVSVPGRIFPLGFGFRANAKSRSLQSARFRSASVGMTEFWVGLAQDTRELESGLEFAGFGEAEFAFGQGEGEEFLDFGFFAVAGHG